MSGNLTYLGGMTVGDCVPAFLGIYGAILGQLEARLDGLFKLQGYLAIHKPSLQGNLEAAAKLLASLRLAVAANLPGIDFKVSAVAAAIAKIEADIGAFVALQAAMGSAGVHAYAYDGDEGSFGPCVTNLPIPGAAPSDHMNAIVLATTIPATWAAMGRIFVQ
jgi:hypothetical protein